MWANINTNGNCMLNSIIADNEKTVDNIQFPRNIMPFPATLMYIQARKFVDKKIGQCSMLLRSKLWIMSTSQTSGTFYPQIDNFPMSEYIFSD